MLTISNKCSLKILLGEILHIHKEFIDSNVKGRTITKYINILDEILLVVIDNYKNIGALYLYTLSLKLRKQCMKGKLSYIFLQEQLKLMRMCKDYDICEPTKSNTGIIPFYNKQ